MNPEPTYEEVYDTNKLKTIIANTPHEYNGKKVKCYHGITRGLILNEIVKTVDKKGRSIGKLFKEINPEYNIEFYLGLEESNSHRRARWYNYPILDILTLFLPERMMGSKAVKYDKSVIKKGSNLSKIFRLKVSKDQDFANATDLRTIEFPSFNGHSNARSLGTMGAIFANEGILHHKRFISESEIKEAISEGIKATDVAVFRETEMTKGDFGVFIYKELGEYSNVSFYGWGGIGGSCIRFPPEYKLSFAYVMNAQHIVMLSEGRAISLLCAAFKQHMKVFNKG